MYIIVHLLRITFLVINQMDSHFLVPFLFSRQLFSSIRLSFYFSYSLSSQQSCHLIWPQFARSISVCTHFRSSPVVLFAPLANYCLITIAPYAIDLSPLTLHMIRSFGDALVLVVFIANIRLGCFALPQIELGLINQANDRRQWISSAQLPA